uniref:Uncharacterized protein n=1 Tax=Meloidogyne javanica TaxID=6303 RepID=A0A915M7Z7_MELJA
MRDKAKMLLLPFNLVWLALIIASNFDVGDTASNFDEDGVLKESRIKRLEKIAEIDNLTGMPRGEEIANELKKYDEIVKNSKNVGEMLEEGVMIRTVKLVLGQDGVEMLGGLCAMLRVPRGDAGGYELLSMHPVLLVDYEIDMPGNNMRLQGINNISF